MPEEILFTTGGPRFGFYDHYTHKLYVISSVTGTRYIFPLEYTPEEEDTVNIAANTNYIVFVCQRYQQFGMYMEIFDIRTETITRRFTYTETRDLLNSKAPIVAMRVIPWIPDHFMVLRMMDIYFYKVSPTSIELIQYHKILPDMALSVLMKPNMIIIDTYDRYKPICFDKAFNRIAECPILINTTAYSINSDIIDYPKIRHFEVDISGLSWQTEDIPNEDLPYYPGPPRPIFLQGTGNILYNSTSKLLVVKKFDNTYKILRVIWNQTMIPHGDNQLIIKQMDNHFDFLLANYVRERDLWILQLLLEREPPELD